ncbi:hypothetical protein [Pontibacter pudoricolor]|uniref:hypothetical protein n=1 Tax=Pontibacter pudoricolor TaxID=2694930 RepID=UPI001390D54F|nr:hypothetical protein [Pontibacter pudoricolor]
MKLYIASLFIAGLLFSCSGNHTLENGHAEVHAEQSELSLNGVERWQADDATNANIQQLQQLMQDHLSQPDTSNLEAINELGHVLQLGFDEVFNECRMKGPEHDMLHVYLVPMLEDVKTLKADDLETAIAARDRLASRLAQYQTYFK